jgi:hypothetical protein
VRGRLQEGDDDRVLTARRLLIQLEEVDDLFTQFDYRILDLIMDKGKSDPDHFVPAYELIAKVDAMYAKVGTFP